MTYKFGETVNRVYEEFSPILDSPYEITALVLKIVYKIMKEIDDNKINENNLETSIEEIVKNEINFNDKWLVIIHYKNPESDNIKYSQCFDWFVYDITKCLVLMD